MDAKLHVWGGAIMSTDAQLYVRTSSFWECGCDSVVGSGGLLQKRARKTRLAPKSGASAAKITQTGRAPGSPPPAAWLIVAHCQLQSLAIYGEARWLDTEQPGQADVPCMHDNGMARCVRRVLLMSFATRHLKPRGTHQGVPPPGGVDT